MSRILLLTVAFSTAASSHRFSQLTSTKTKSVSSCSNVDGLYKYDLPAILKERVVGTPSHAEVRDYIVSRLKQLGSRWEVTLDTFTDHTPHGVKEFTNIIATLDPHVDKRLVLAAHYDSKFFADGHFPGNARFLGATDSALPCALLLDLALTFNEKLQARKLMDSSLQLIFFDGEEAFRIWSDTDSIYGARHLAQAMSQENGLLSVGDKTGLKAIEYFVLLDLIGAANPRFYDQWPVSSVVFQRFVRIEERLHNAGLLKNHQSSYFVKAQSRNLHIQDDHIPFLRRGVPIVHLIAFPFPSVWHKHTDNHNALDRATIENLHKIFTVFLHEYFHLK
jgi:glutaminyl-peptide cyclotransferase